MSESSNAESVVDNIVWILGQGSVYVDTVNPHISNAKVSKSASESAASLLRVLVESKQHLDKLDSSNITDEQMNNLCLLVLPNLDKLLVLLSSISNTPEDSVDVSIENVLTSVSKVISVISEFGDSFSNTLENILSNDSSSDDIGGNMVCGLVHLMKRSNVTVDVILSAVNSLLNMCKTDKRLLKAALCQDMLVPLISLSGDTQFLPISDLCPILSEKATDLAMYGMKEGSDVFSEDVKNVSEHSPLNSGSVESKGDLEKAEDSGEGLVDKLESNEDAKSLLTSETESFSTKHENVTSWTTVLNSKSSFKRYIHSDVTALHAAIVGEHIEIIKTLIKLGARTDILDGKQQTPLMRAISLGNELSVEILLKSGKELLIDAADIAGNPTLKLAFLTPPKQQLNELYNMKTNSSTKTNTKTITTCDAKMAFLLLEQGVVEDVNVIDFNGESPLHWIVGGCTTKTNLCFFDVQLVSQPNTADVSERSKMIHCLAKHGINFNLCDKSGNSALHVAVKECRRELCNALLSAGAMPNILNCKSQLPIHLACSHNNGLGLVATLAEAGDGSPFFHGESSTPQAEGMTASDRALRRIKQTMMHGLQEALTPVSVSRKVYIVNFQDQYGNTPLHYACGADPNNLNNYSTVILSREKIQDEIRDRIAIFEYLITDNKSSLKFKSEKGHSILHCAVIWSGYQFKNTKNIQNTEEQNIAATKIQAQYRGKRDAVLVQEMRVNKSDVGKMKYSVANTEEQNIAATKIQAQYRGKRDAVLVQEMRATSHPVIPTQLSLIESIIRNGAELDTLDKASYTLSIDGNCIKEEGMRFAPIHYAKKCGYVEISEYLLKSGAKENIKDFL